MPIGKRLAPCSVVWHFLCITCMLLSIQADGPLHDRRLVWGTHTLTNKGNVFSSEVLYSPSHSALRLLVTMKSLKSLINSPVRVMIATSSNFTASSSALPLNKSRNPEIVEGCNHSILMPSVMSERVNETQTRDRERNAVFKTFFLLH